MIKNEKIKLIYRIILVLITFIALYLNFKSITIGQGLLYFTILSNLFCSIFFTIDVICMLIKKDIYTEKYVIIKGMATMCITLTMLVYNIVLTKVIDTSSMEVVANSLVHIVVPLLVIFDYILFDKKNMLKKKYVLYWLLPLVFYTIYILIYIFIGGRFIDNEIVPYPILNFEKLGYLKVVFNSLLIYIGYTILGLIYIFIDNKIKVK